MRKKIWILIALLSVLFMLTGCEKEETETQLFAPKDGRFQMTIPVSWHETSDAKTSSADLKLSNEKNTAFIMVVSADKSDHKRTIKEYLENEQKKLEDKYSPMDMTTSTENFGSYKGTCYAFNTTMQTFTVHMEVYIFETEHYLAKSYVWSLNSDWKKEEDTLRSITETFSEQ